MKITSADKSLAEAMGIEPIVKSTQSTPYVAKPLISIPIDSSNRISADADYARENALDIIQKGSEALDQAMEIARESQHPRMYEVLGQLLKIQSDNVDKLLKIQSEKQKLIGNTNTVDSTGNVTIEKAVFVGTTDQLLDMIKRTEKDSIGIDYDDN